MSYLDRLVEQSGLRPAGGPAGAAAPLPPGYGPVALADDRLVGSAGGEQLDVVESVVPARVPPAGPRPGPPGQPLPAPPVPAVVRGAPADGVEHLDRATRPAPHPPEGGSTLPPTPDRDAPPDQDERAATRRPSAPDTPPALPDPVPDQVVTRHETLLRVVEWLAAEPRPTPAPQPEVEARPAAEPASAVREVAESAEPAAPRSTEPAPPSPRSSPREVRQDEHEPPPARTEPPVEVWIDAVNLTLEAPTPATAPAVPGAVAVPVLPPPAPPLRAPRHPVQPRTATTDRLSRRYVRV